MATLAVKGGKSVIPGGMKASWPVFDEADKQALIRVLESGKWGRLSYEKPEDSEVGKFEGEFSRFIGVRHGVAVTNGTAALEIALRAGGVESGDEVIVPAVTFIATATAVLAVNAIPIFVDMVPDTYQLDPDAVEKAVTEKTRAIVPVHYAGYPVDMDRIIEVAGRHGLLVVEDCAHAHGSEWRGRRVGSIGDLGCFSLQSSKTLNCGEGGIIVTDSDDLAAKCFSYHHIGRVPGRPFYEHHLAAGNYRMTEFQGALLRTQLARLGEQTETRYRAGEHLAKRLGEIDGVSALRRDPRVTNRGYYFFVVRYEKDGFGGVHRDVFMDALRAEGVPCGAGYGVPLYRNPVFTEKRFGRGHPALALDYSAVRCPVADRVLAEEQITLNTHLLLNGIGAMDQIADAVQKIKDNAGELGELARGA